MHPLAPSVGLVRPVRTLVRLWFATPLWRRILFGLVLGVFAGAVLGERAQDLKWIGDLFVRLIRMLVTPLVFVSVAAGVASMSDLARLGSVGLKTVLLYVGLMLIGAAIGLTIGELVQPGAGVDLAGVVPAPPAEAQALGAALMNLVPLNPIAAMAAGDMSGVIVFALLIGGALLTTGEEGRPLRRGLESASAVLLRVVRFVMELAPFGVFALIAWVMGSSGPTAFVSVFRLAFCVLLGAVVQIFIVHGAVLRLLARAPVLPFYRGVIEVMAVAFSTASSAATLPVTMRAALRNLGVSPAIASTVLPLGVTLSMDGTALYVALLAAFSAQVFGVALGPADYLAIMAVTALVALGAAPAPSASLFLLAAVLSVIGLGPDQTALIVGFLLPFDRPLDMIRTVPNCTSDLSVAVAVARMEGELNLETYNERPLE